MESDLPPLKQVYWALVSISFAALLFGMAPKEGTEYAKALEELQHLDKLGLRVDDTYSYIEQQVFPKYAPHIGQVIKNELDQVGKKVASPSVLDEDFFMIDEGPLTLPDKLSSILSLFQNNPGYIVKLPNMDILRAKLRSVLMTSDKKYEVLERLSISCNWYNDQCMVDIQLTSIESLVKPSDPSIEFLVPAVTIELKDTRWGDIIRSKDKFFTNTAMMLPNITLVIAEFHDRSVGETIREIAQKQKSESGQIEIFGVTVPSTLAKFITPIILAGLAIFLLINLREIKQLKSDQLQTFKNLPIFSETQLGLVFGYGLVLLLPIAATTLIVLKFFALDSISSWIGIVAGIILLIVEFLIFKLSLLIRQLLVKPEILPK